MTTSDATTPPSPSSSSPGSPTVTLVPITSAELPNLIERMQRSFAQAVLKHFGTSEPIPSAQEIEKAYAAEHSDVCNIIHNDVCNIIHNGEIVGGVVLTIHKDTGRNSLDLFFIDLGRHSRGLGLAAWKAIEARYPGTRVWETVTPYFEQRNIHFYINKCGFRAVEFFNPHHRAPQHPAPAGGTPEPPGMDAFFRFEKHIPQGRTSYHQSKRPSNG